MSEYAIQFNVKDHIARLTLTSPQLDAAEAQTLKEICTDVNGNEDVYVVLLTGSAATFCKDGEKAAQAGAEEAAAFAAAAAIAAIDRPVIAAINGEASGLGLELALAADIRIASDNALFGMPQVKDGLIPAGGGTQRLPRIIGRGKALEMLLTADTLTAAQALEIGLVSKVVPAAELMIETQKLAETVAAKGPLALRYLKEAIIKGMDMTLEQGLRLEADLYFLLHTTSDRTEGIKSYLEKRTPKYEGK
jgi:enoyl-CoA hydratase/carnithine racemase